MTVMEFWYDFASPYAYLSAMRIEKLAEEAGITLRWRPIIIGPLFKAFGHETGPNFDNKLKWDYLMLDMTRLAKSYGYPISLARLENTVSSVLGARVALLLWREGEGEDNNGLCPEFTRRLSTAIFGEGRDISDPRIVAEVLNDMGEDGEAVIARALSPENKEALKEQVSAAQAAELFGVPSFILPDRDNELFWGNDRLEQAIAAAAVG